MTSAVDKPKVRAMAGIPRWMRNSFWYVLLIAVSALVLFPLWMTFVRAVSDPAAYSSRLKSGVPLMPVQPDWGIFNAAFDQGNLGRAAVQSLVMSVVITGAQVVTAVLAAYAFSFLRFPFKRLMFAVFMATMMLPLEVTLRITGACSSTSNSVSAPTKGAEKVGRRSSRDSWNTV